MAARGEAARSPTPMARAILKVSCVHLQPQSGARPIKRRMMLVMPASIADIEAVYDEVMSLVTVDPDADVDVDAGTDARADADAGVDAAAACNVELMGHLSHAAVRAHALLIVMPMTPVRGLVEPLFYIHFDAVAAIADEVALEAACHFSIRLRTRTPDLNFAATTSTDYQSWMAALWTATNLTAPSPYLTEADGDGVSLAEEEPAESLDLGASEHASEVGAPPPANDRGPVRITRPWRAAATTSRATPLVSAMKPPGTSHPLAPAAEPAPLGRVNTTSSNWSRLQRAYGPISEDPDYDPETEEIAYEPVSTEDAEALHVPGAKRDMGGQGRGQGQVDDEAEAPGNGGRGRPFRPTLDARGSRNAVHSGTRRPHRVTYQDEYE
ncbi:hypothetical protein CXG81DRAFT_19141 [Caulochytrium protostelioides]|uniref:PH domain-containing protein n=1 Tax=Caulochytrium protostelioides TaxID=1555241 RepID=A0A4P9X702_9FUNG|nr:hypothetical protein CXG81DRAFT_19141 [Caulochytrium protostelioides]|eukprot:RKP00994.1 hypothetical protein CXG81DRAFT_19141 [Caulochytrium protostelioides]